MFQHLYKFSDSHGGLLYAWFPAMHTRVDLLLRGMQGEDLLLRAVGAIRQELCRLEKMGNCYDAGSELACLNRTASVKPQPVSRELYDMLAFCIDCYTRTDGCFDVTVHSDCHTQESVHTVRLSPGEQTLFFSRPGVTINLSGFLKGYALEKIRPLFRQFGVDNALVNMGNSSVLALGCQPQAEGWKVNFGQSRMPGERAWPDFLLKNECLTTSGNDSHTRKHIIDPRSGKLIEGKREVAVVTANGAVGEVLSTSLFVAESGVRERLKKEFCPRLIFDF